MGCLVDILLLVVYWFFLLSLWLYIVSVRILMDYFVCFVGVKDVMIFGFIIIFFCGIYLVCKYYIVFCSVIVVGVDVIVCILVILIFFVIVYVKRFVIL